MNGRGRGSGWHGDSRRHGMARKGIRTTRGDSMRSMGKRQRFLKNSKGKRVFTGEVSHTILTEILKYEYDEWSKHYGGHSGYHQEGEKDDIWVAWDNSSGDLWVEEFYNKENARLFATELQLTHTEIHQKDIQDVIKNTLKPIREEERVVLGSTTITDGIEADLMEYATKKKNLTEFTTGSIDEFAIILKRHEEDEKVLLRDDDFVSDMAMNRFGNFFLKNLKAYKRSNYYNIVQGEN